MKKFNTEEEKADTKILKQCWKWLKTHLHSVAEDSQRLLKPPVHTNVANKLHNRQRNMAGNLINSLP